MKLRKPNSLWGYANNTSDPLATMEQLKGYFKQFYYQGYGKNVARRLAIQEYELAISDLVVSPSDNGRLTDLSFTKLNIQEIDDVRDISR